MGRTIGRLAIKNDSGGLWRVETAHQNKSRKTGQLFFGQIRTLELRNSARFVQTALICNFPSNAQIAACL